MTFTGELTRIQSELGSQHTFREAEYLLDLFSNCERKVNNHVRVKQSVESVGLQVSQINNIEKEVLTVEPAEQLIINVDGGHIKTRETGKRSMEAMTAVVYRPESLLSNTKEIRNYLSSKHCAASVKDDNQEDIISPTLMACLKQGLSTKQPPSKDGGLKARGLKVQHSG
ncbi:hypothetical protein HQQ94_06540 [Shewanella sp. VB17]|uniref:hypothetical protein n=1 Tax=Shewanella sp. VB17 TaxID=2739432 RepID=UPI00156651B2|nr:hypothetical protein [Shewanella sp. VB17]NRD72901.1 hypothetical protein [Shewanella sp. VB17]